MPDFFFVLYFCIVFFVWHLRHTNVGTIFDMFLFVGVKIVAFSTGLKIFTTLLGGGAGNDGIDKVDNGNASPMQVCALIWRYLT